jgi:hypothetical protein
LPGFMVKWHATDNYEVINQAFREMYSDDKTVDNDVRLMAVWLSNRLPYENNQESEDN